MCPDACYWSQGWALSRKPHSAHQTLHLLTVDCMPLLPQTRRPCVGSHKRAGWYTPDQSVGTTAGLHHRALHSLLTVVDRPWRAKDLPAHTVDARGVDPLPSIQPFSPTDFIAQLFLSQSTSIFRRPISPYRRSSLPVSVLSAGFGTASGVKQCWRFPESLSHRPTITGWTPYSCAISLMVLTPLTASAQPSP